MSPRRTLTASCAAITVLGLATAPAQAKTTASADVSASVRISADAGARLDRVADLATSSGRRVRVTAERLQARAHRDLKRAAEAAAEATANASTSAEVDAAVNADAHVLASLGGAQDADLQVVQEAHGRLQAKAAAGVEQTANLAHDLSVATAQALADARKRGDEGAQALEQRLQDVNVSLQATLSASAEAGSSSVRAHLDAAAAAMLRAQADVSDALAASAQRARDILQPVVERVVARAVQAGRDARDIVVNSGRADVAVDAHAGVTLGSLADVTLDGSVHALARVRAAR